MLNKTLCVFFNKYANLIQFQMDHFFQLNIDVMLNQKKKYSKREGTWRSRLFDRFRRKKEEKKVTNFRLQAKKRVSNLICQTVRQGCLRLYGGHAGLEIMSCPLFHWLSPIYKRNHFMWNWWIGEFAKCWIGYDFWLRFQMTGSDRMAQGILLHE